MSAELQLNIQQPALFASERFIEGFPGAWLTAISVHPPDLTETVQMATATRGRPTQIGAVTLQLGRELSPRTKFYPVNPNHPLSTATGEDSLRPSQIRDAANLQELKVLRIKTDDFNEEGLRRATYRAALRRPLRGFAGGGGGALGLAGYVIETGFNENPSLPRLALYVGAGLVVGAAAGTPLVMRAKYRADRDMLQGATPIEFRPL